MPTGLSTRCLVPEQMDNSQLDQACHHAALDGLSRINWWSRSAQTLWPLIAGLTHQLAPRATRILDIATGGGDVPIRLWQRAARRRLPLEIHGCDRSPVAVAHAKTLAQRRGAPVDFFPLDALTQRLPTTYDVLTCSLFLHHLTTADAITLLQRMRAATRHLVLVLDLARTRLGLGLAHAGTHLLTRSTVVHHDGPQSVRAAYTARELHELADAAGLASVSIRTAWPCRLLLVWRRDE